MKQQRIIFAVAMSMAFAAHAEPQKSDADAWLGEFRKARESSMDALVLKDPAKRRELMPKLMSLRDRAEKLFGPAMPYEFGTCSAAASAAVSILENEIGLMMGASHPEITVSGLATLAWEGAQQYAVCRDKVENLQ